MKLALVHELLTMRGGAECVFKVLADMYPEAPIYTLLYDEKLLGDWFPKERVRVATYRFPYSVLPSTNHHLFLSQFPNAVERWDFSEFDTVLSTSSGFVHGIITNSNPKHLSYINSPARYLWDRTHDVLDRAGNGPVRKYLEHLFHKLRVWDAESAPRADKLLAASKEVQRRIELYWRLESEVVYPPVDDYWLHSDQLPVISGQSPYVFIASTLVPYKRIEIAIETCNTLNITLKIAGEGPHRKALEHLAGPKTEFLGFVELEALRTYYANATAVLFPGKEDFGLVPLEAMSCGTPVIAYGKGGALETIVEGQTGTFFAEDSAESLTETLQNFKPDIYAPDACRARAALFSREKFEKGIRSAISNL